MQTGCASVSSLPELSKAYNDRGRAKLILDEDYRGAVEDFTLAIEFNPEDADLYVGRGMAYLKMGHREAAQKDFDKAASLNSNLKKALRQLVEK